jgi:hypothetical protein
MSLIKITAKVAFQDSGILFELTETKDVDSSSLRKEDIDEIKHQMLTDNLISINNFHNKIQGEDKT